MAGLANPVLTLTRDKPAKTVRAVATCRILFNQIELAQMEQGLLQFVFRAKLFGADRAGGGTQVDEDLFTYVPYTIYPDATPGNVEDATFDEVLAEIVLDEDIIGTDEVFARFLLINLNSDKRVSRDSARVSVRL